MTLAILFLILIAAFFLYRAKKQKLPHASQKTPSDASNRIKKIFAVILFVWGGISIVSGIAKPNEVRQETGVAESHLIATIGVGILPMILGAWLWGKPSKNAD